MSSVPSAKGLEGGEDEEDSQKVQPSEFFWDSITLYVALAIVALSSIDLVIEFVRQPEVRCFSRNNQTELADNQLQDYVNEFCYGTSALSNINIFRISFYILGFSLAALHYLWLNYFRGKFAFFFQLVSDVKRYRSEETGDYPKENLIIADQLEESFTTFQQNSIFWAYLLKLLLQLLLSIAGVVGIGYYFTRLQFNASFYCPETMEDTLDMTGPWPLTGEHVTCVYTSFPLLELLCIADMALLALAIVLLTASLIWCSASHSKQLGYKDIAVFVFQTGLPLRYFVPNFKVSDSSTCCQVFYYCLSSIPWLPLRGPKISTDLDFMMMRLFRTDGGLGHVLKEILVLKEVKNMNDDDNRKYSLHNEEQRLDEYRTGDLVKKGDCGDLRWKFDKNKSENPDTVYLDGVYDEDNVGSLPMVAIPSVNNTTIHKPVLRMPDTVRGAVLGFSSYVQERTVVLCLSFGSPSTSFATALARVFVKVVAINFSPYYYNPDKPVEQVETDDCITLTCAEDVLSKQTTKQNLIDLIHAARNQLPFNFILVSPLHKSAHRSTVNYLIYLLQFKQYIDADAALLTVTPLSISSKHTSVMEAQDQPDCLDEAKIDFYQYYPPKSLFPSPVTHRVQTVKDRTLVWPKFDIEVGSVGNTPTLSSDDITLCVISPSAKFKIKTRMSFKLFSKTSPSAVTPPPTGSGAMTTMSAQSGGVHHRAASPPTTTM